MSGLSGGFGAYAQTVKHHSLLLRNQAQRIDYLEDANAHKDTTICELENEGTFMAARIEALERQVEELQTVLGKEYGN